MRTLINHYKKEGEWKIQLIAEINFISLKPASDETCVMYTRSDNEEFMNGGDTNEIIKLLFESFLQRFEENLQEKMRGSDFEFDGINFFYYNFNKTGIYRGGSYIDSPKWLEDKKSAINPKNNDHKCFQYAATLALNFDNINNHPEKISKIRPFIDQYNWKDIDFPPTNKDWKKFELNNKVALNILYIPHNTKKIQLAYRSKYNLTYNKQIILLMITDGEKWHYLVVKNLSGLFKGITSNHYSDFYCLNCFHSYRKKNKLEAHQKICENHDHCHVEMPTKDNNIIKYNHGEKSVKLPFLIYTDLECLLEKMSTCQNDPNKSSTTKINKHTPSGYSIFTHCNKKHHKVGDHCHYTGKYRGAAHNICNLRYKVPKEIPAVFHNGSTYDYHLIIKELVKEFEGNFECLGENTEKYITFSVPIKKKIENKDLEITYKIKFIDSYRFMSSSLSKLVDNLSEGIHNNKCLDCNSCLDYVRITKNGKLLLKCFNCDSSYKKKFNKDLIKKFKNT